MAQYFIKATDAGVLSNFTERNAGGTLAVVDDGGEAAIRLSLPSNNRVFWSFDPIGIGQDFEIVARLRTGAAATDRTGAAVGARISGDSAFINAFRFADIGFRDGQIGSYVNGSFSQRSRPSDVVADIRAYHWLRGRASGDLLQIKVWDGAPEDEPAPWSSEHSVSLSFPDGRAGLFVFEVGNHYYTDIGFASNGDVAPTEPVVSGITLTVDSILLTMAMDSAPLTQANQLAVDDLQLQTSLDGVSLQQANVLSPDDLSLSSFLDEITLSSAGQLNVNSLQLNIGLESVELQQANVLSVDSLQLSTLLETAELQQANQLMVEGLLLTTTFESPDISVGLTLVPDSIWLSALLDQVSLTQSHLLTVDDLTQSIGLDNVTLTVAGQVIGPGTLTIGITGPSISIGISP